MAAKISPFLHPSAVAENDRLAIVYLRRDQQIPTILKERDDDDEGYSEGKVVNTRFGSFPHNTLIGLPWGSQVRASKVDTGSRGRRTQKRKREESEPQDAPEAAEEGTAPAKQAVTASSGFIHILPPTPESWTSSLPHRTQVVYTPDYSYILHRIRARPGSRLIEAGAGSGSFTHASSRAVYSGYPSLSPLKRRKLGKVYSYEFHEQRHAKLVTELADHGLDGIVHITHRDVCADGFLVGENKDESPAADAIFLDLPAPWLALPHLSRRPQPSAIPTPADQQPKPFVSALNPNAPINLCTFSPCIEQVQRTISTMRQLGWVQIEMVEVQHKRLEIRRERIGILHGQNQHGVQNTPASVEEAVAKLQEIEGRFRTFHGAETDGADENGALEGGERATKKRKDQPNSKQAILESLVERKAYKEGNLMHKTEPEVKTHTSYLVFAVLPMEWTEEEEAKAAARWPVKVIEMNGKGKDKEEGEKKISNREAKRLAKEKARVEREKREVNGRGDVKDVEGAEGAGNVDAMVE